ncbi:hypothetical protein BDR07DRAFT_1378439 [Suillus spraguei]|nr:hypothetical protein BDR07DRAFT_1378439 [Suillus spraguei]
MFLYVKTTLAPLTTRVLDSFPTPSALRTFYVRAPAYTGRSGLDDVILTGYEQVWQTDNLDSHWIFLITVPAPVLTRNMGHDRPRPNSCIQQDIQVTRVKGKAVSVSQFFLLLNVRSTMVDRVYEKSVVILESDQVIRTTQAMVHGTACSQDSILIYKTTTNIAARMRERYYGYPKLLFVDEVHRSAIDDLYCCVGASHKYSTAFPLLLHSTSFFHSIFELQHAPDIPVESTMSTGYDKHTSTLVGCLLISSIKSGELLGQAA